LFLLTALFLLKQLNKTTTLITTGSRFLWRKNVLFAGEMLGMLTIKAHQINHQSPLMLTIKAH
jgi:hypothetical protein